LAPSSAAGRDDNVLTPAARASFFEAPVRVEEKLDGANVSLWSPDGRRVEVATRGGADAVDRGRQLGRLRAWVGERTPALLAGIADDVLYGEWLYLTHGVSYDALPSLLVGLDVLAQAGWLDAAARDARLEAMSLPAPPVLFEGRLHDEEQLRALLEQPSRFGAPAIEGVVLRRAAHAGPRLVKVVRAAHRPPTDAQWRGGRRLNRVS